MTGDDSGLPPLLPSRRRTWDARQIAALREERGWTQEKLAEFSGLSVRTVRNLELGAVQNPRRSSVDLLAHALGFDLQEEPEHHQEPEIHSRVLWRGPPPPASVLVGGRTEHGQLAQTVRNSRLTTFFGPGGIGKTRLALSVAAEIGPSFRDGVAVVELGDLVPERHSRGSQTATVLQRVRRQLWSGRPPGAGVSAAVDGERDMNLLLVLDNAEHVPDGVTAVTRELLGTCPGMQVLITARRRLTERMGVNRQIQPLAVEAAPGAPLSEAPAVELVLWHVGTESGASTVVGKDLPLVAELCRRLGGLPRYLEFAAERMRTIPVRQLLAYGPTIEMLQSNDHALLKHQRSVADSIRWNLDLLADEHVQLLTWIAALPTHWFTLDDVATEHDRTGMIGANPLTLLSDLHEVSLIVGDPDDRYRYRLAPFVGQVTGRLRSAADELERWRCPAPS